MSRVFIYCHILDIPLIDLPRDVTRCHEMSRDVTGFPVTKGVLQRVKHNCANENISKFTFYFHSKDEK